MRELLAALQCPKAESSQRSEWLCFSYLETAILLRSMSVVCDGAGLSGLNGCCLMPKVK